MQQIDLAIARLRLLIADVEAKLASTQQAERQCREQLERLVDRGVYGEAPLEGLLGMMSDVDERLRAAQARRQHLELVRARVAAELDSLEITRGIERAKAELGTLQAEMARLERARESDDADARAAALLDEIHRLQQAINEAAERAARSLPGGRVPR